MATVRVAALPGICSHGREIRPGELIMPGERGSWHPVACMAAFERRELATRMALYCYELHCRLDAACERVYELEAELEAVR